MLALILVVGSFTACGGSNDTGGADATEVKIGVNYELTGAVATYGEASTDGILMFEEINTAGGINRLTIVQ